VRYRKISPRIWGDERFRALSAPRPNAQTLWIYLLTGPHTTLIPGLFSAGEAGLAEALGWPLKSFRGAFQELHCQGMAQADWQGRVVYLPKALKYNPPESPSVVKSWAGALDELPECQLKHQAIEAFRVWLAGCGAAWVAAWLSALFKSSDDPAPHQEQEQEQEQERRAPAGNGVLDGFEQFWKAYPRKKAKGRAEQAWRKVVPQGGLLDTILAAIEVQKHCRDWTKDNGEFIPYPATWLTARRWEDETAPPTALTEDDDDAP